MSANISSRRHSINTIVLLIVVFAATNISQRVPDFEKSPGIQAIALATSKGVYELMVHFLFWVIDSWEFALRLYWGKLYIKGVWSYEYTLNGKAYRGVWDIRQDVNGTTVVGNGLDEDFRLRTIVRSVSPLFEEAGGYYFINSRNEMMNDNAQVFSKTTLLLDHTRGFLKGVTSMRGITVVYGGPSDRQLHPNVVFLRHEHIGSIEELIEKMRTGAQRSSNP